MFTALPDTDRFLPGCYHDPRFSPAEGDWTDKKTLTDLCKPALPTCTPCPFRAQCIRQVQPHPKKFDGICGGRLWLDGRVIAVADDVDDEDLPLSGKPRTVCGETAGVAEHQASGERQCPACAAFTAAEAERAAAEAQMAELAVAA
ncbi:hypothetical protein ACFV4P_03040 [Kitasatospora sp. NPDC059795]|uniref:hypothetical protein n=1 Tax=Kitasatospora sp. NPDC059795 TaxID=3346949 RepID=UPI00364D5D59